MKKLMLIAVAMVLACAAAGPALAGVDVDFGANVPLGDDSQLFFHISSRYFDVERPEVDQAARLWPDPDDFAVGLFIARQARRPVQAIFDLRRSGLPWWEIGVRVGVPVDAYFVPLSGAPRPPYGKAYGYWNRRQHNPRFKFHLTDPEVRDLVALRMLHDYYGAPPERAMAWRAERRETIRDLMIREYRGRHGEEKDRRAWADREGKDHGRAPGHEGQKGPKGKGHGKDKGKGRDKDRN